jgi:NAD(P)-dependent dehydrogenase (short-subunit alcohol dehydrogenase family)
MKNVIITGAAQGIGYFLVKQLLTDKYNVTVLDLDVGNLGALSKEWPSLLTLVCDVRDSNRIKECVEESVLKFGSVDCAIHNACRCTFESMNNTDDATYRDVFDVNYFGALYLSQAVLPHMKQQKAGKVIFTSSGVGVMGFINISPYASSKGAIESLAKCLNIEYQNDGISFHIFHPPLTRTKSAEPLPIPKEFMVPPEKVGVGLAKHINKKSFIICHSAGQKLQTLACYMFPIKMGRLMSKMTANYGKQSELK